MSHEREKNINDENEIDNDDPSINLNIENDEKYISLSLKYDKLSRDYKNIETKLNNTIQINIDNFTKMEQHYKQIIKEKENEIEELHKKTNNKEVVISNNLGKIINNFINDTNKTLIENKLTPEFVELISKNIEKKIDVMIEEINTFFENKVQLIETFYKKRLNLILEENNKLKLEILKEKYNAIDINVKDKVNNEIINEFEDQIKELRNIIENKENIIMSEREKTTILNNEYTELQKKYSELQMQNSQNVFALKMKEDEVDTLIMIIDATHHMKRGKYLHNLNRLSEDVKQEVENIINTLKIFKKKKE
jgi:methionine-rich copper-binding protein CopC